MPWVRLDDQYPDHPKIRGVGAIGLALQTAAICYCGRYLTDGFLSYSSADALIRSVLSPFTQADGTIWTVAVTSGMSGEDADELEWKALLVQAGLWEPVEGGYLVHDYLEYNPSKRDYMQTLKLKRKAGQAGGQASAQARAQRIVKQNSTTTRPRPVPRKKEELPPIVPPPGDEFERFWTAYPKKIGKGKARDAWVKAAKKKASWPGPVPVLAAVAQARQSAAWTKDGGQFIPHPATWLNQERWADTLSPSPEEPPYGHFDDPPPR